MKMTYRCLLLLAGSTLFSTALPCWAQPSEKELRIVRVISTSDEAPREAQSLFPSGFARKRGYLGVQMIDLTRELRLHFGAPSDAGVMISRVLEDSPASQAGLEPGDILVAVDGEPLHSGIQLERRISPLDDQTDVTLEIVRRGSSRTVPVTIVERERPAIDLGRLALSSPGKVHELVWVGPEEIEKRVLHIDPKGLEDALRELEVRFEKPDFVERFGSLGQSRLDLQRRIQELEQRLQSLELQLEEFSKN